MPHRPRHGSYGIDFPYVPLGFVVAALAFALWAIPAGRAGQRFDVRGRLAAAALLAVQGASYLYTTRRGKFVIWQRLLDGMPWRGDERVLDLGCGRGAVLTLVAQRLVSGKAVGVDIWRAGDQSGNSPQACQQNIVRERVGNRAVLTTADIRELPFTRGSFDLVVSSLAIHNISDATGRARALAHVTRVLAPGGRVMIADIKNTRTVRERVAAARDDRREGPQIGMAVLVRVAVCGHLIGDCTQGQPYLRVADGSNRQRALEHVQHWLRRVAANEAIPVAREAPPS